MRSPLYSIGAASFSPFTNDDDAIHGDRSQYESALALDCGAVARVLVATT